MDAIRKKMQSMKVNKQQNSTKINYKYTNLYSWISSYQNQKPIKYCVFQFDIDALYQKNAEYEEDIRNSNSISDQFDIQIRDTGKKVQKFETSFEEILEKMTASAAKMDEAEKEFKDKDDDVNAAARRVVLMEGEATVSVEKLATTVMKLALMSKEADNIIKV